ncbi:MAG TPA: TonB-dependent receptor [Nevskiaceae bacterium]|nr:TonB-dependent receptor [Nevskiaceae bacterium]
MSTTRIRCGTAIAAGLLASLGPFAGAQEAVSEPATATIPVEPEAAADPAPATPTERDAASNALEEIVVTAQKRSESINSVPIAITAFSGDTMEEMGISDTRDLGIAVPGFSYADSGYSVPIYTLRGVGFNEASQTASATVGIYADEQNLAFPVFSKGANLDLERVEILKGPQGTLYGRNTTGGLVNYIANKPTDAFESGLKTSLSRFETLDAEGFVSGPFTDTLSARAAMHVVDSRKGWQRSLTRPDDRLGEQEKRAARVSLAWKPSESWDHLFTLNGWMDRGEPQAPQAIGFQPQNAITAGLLRDLGLPQQLALTPAVRNHPTVEQDGDSNRVADWSDLDWHNDETFLMGAMRSAWHWTDTSNLTFLGSYGNFRNDHSLIPQTGLSVNNTERDLLVRTEAYAFELRADGQWGENASWLVGGYLSRDLVFEYQSVYIDTDSAAFVPPVPILETVVGPLVSDRADTKGDQEAKTRAVFGSVDVHVAPTLKLNLGARYTREKRFFAGCTIDSPYATQGVGFSPVFNVLSISQGGTGGAMRGDCITLDQETRNPGLFEDTLDEDNVSGRFALDWTPADGTLLYASFSRGFKSGSFPVLAASDQAQYEPAKQEQLDAIEIGAKVDLLGRSLHVNGAAFYYDYKDKQLLGRTYDAVFGPLPILVNAPKAEVYGVEVDLQARPLRGLITSLSGIWLETEVIEGTTKDQDGDDVDLKGRPFNFAPRWELTALADYTWPVTETLELTFGGDVSYTGSTNSVLTEDPLFEIDAYTLFNARVGVGSTSGRWKLLAWVRNVGDSFYSNGVFNTGDTISRYAGEPRLYGLTLTLELGS